MFCIRHVKFIIMLDLGRKISSTEKHIQGIFHRDLAPMIIVVGSCKSLKNYGALSGARLNEYEVMYDMEIFSIIKLKFEGQHILSLHHS